MSDPLFDIVTVNISRNAPSVSQVGFGTAMIVGPNFIGPTRVMFYGKSELTDLAKKLVGGTDSPEYKAISSYFAQNPSPTQVAIGKQASGTVVIVANSGTMTAGNLKYSLDGGVTWTTVNFTTDRSTTFTALATSMQAAIRLLIGSDTSSAAVWNNGASTLTVTYKSGSEGTIPLHVNFSGITGTTTLSSIGSTIAESIEVTMTALLAVSNSWYGFAITDRTLAQQKLAADWAETALMKFFLCSSSDANIIGQDAATDTTTIAWYIKDKTYLKSKAIYSSAGLASYPEMALFGAILWQDPGSYCVMFKSLVGISTDSLTTSQRNNALGKYAMTYEYVHGKNMLSETAASGLSYVDCGIFIDWLTAREAEAVFGALQAGKKVPFTSAGIMAVANAMEQPLKIGQGNGAISPKAYNSDKVQIGGYYLITPKLEDIPILDKGNRALNNMQFVAFYAGAIQKVQINGNVTL